MRSCSRERTKEVSKGLVEKLGLAWEERVEVEKRKKRRERARRESARRRNGDLVMNLPGLASEDDDERCFPGISVSGFERARETE